MLGALVDNRHTMVFYETPHRIVGALNNMVEIFGLERKVCLARELTKTFETIRQLTLGEMLEFVREDLDQQKGEIVLVLEGAGKCSVSDLSQEAISLVDLLLSELPPKKVSKIVSSQHGVSNKLVYDHILSLKKQ